MGNALSMNTNESTGKTWFIKEQKHEKYNY